MGLGISDFAQAQAVSPAKTSNDNACILIFNTGAPAHLDTFDMKPDAPREIRGPFKPIRTNNLEIQISELFPLHAKLADKFSLVRTCTHGSAADHDSGRYTMQTGRLFPEGLNMPHVGCAINYLLGGRNGMPGHVFLPKAMGNTGGYIAPGNEAGFLGDSYGPFSPGRDVKTEPSSLNEALDISKEPLKVRERYGNSRFGESCLRARRLVERGVRFITLHTFTSVFDQPSWDIHGCTPFTTFSGMRDLVAPMYDKAYSALIEDLAERGMLDSTLVAALSEFGRTPGINAAGGRDHWTHCFTSYFAGGGVQGGRVIGKSDAIGAYPTERSVSPGEIMATIHHALGLDLQQVLPNGARYVSSGTRHIHELF